MARGSVNVPGAGPLKQQQSLQQSVQSLEQKLDGVDTTVEALVDEKINAITPASIGAAAASHNQAASTITAGTFAGQVVAKSDAQAPGTACLRNSSVSLTESTPSVNGQINWLAE